MASIQACVIAGTHSGCGKTSVALGLMAALARRGRKVQPFKCGPDFIDPGHHERACALEGEVVASHCLDGWMLTPQTLRDIFHRQAAEADVAVVEGVMGLYDGFSATDEAGSTAHLAKILGLPVILVVDARSMARSAAALVTGFKAFDPGLNLAGVIFNRVGSEGHAELLREAMAVATDIPVFGCLPRDDSLTMPSRHLGLVTADEGGVIYDRLADWLESAMDPDEFLERLPRVPLEAPFDPLPPVGRARIGLARDEAFNFYYQENLRLLRQAGARLVPFSPLHDRDLPEGLDALYLGGGYPEVHAFDLGQNSRMRKQVKAFCQSGRPVYAECGGFMYLMNDVVVPEGGRYPMAGFFPVRAEMGERFRALGYRQVELAEDTFFGPRGTLLRGHEFHYSAIQEVVPPEMRQVYAVTSRKGELSDSGGYLMGNALGSYIHLHFGSCPAAAERFVAAALAGRDRDG